MIHCIDFYLLFRLYFWKNHFPFIVKWIFANFLYLQETSVYNFPFYCFHFLAPFFHPYHLYSLALFITFDGNLRLDRFEELRRNFVFVKVLFGKCLFCDAQQFIHMKFELDIYLLLLYNNWILHKYNSNKFFLFIYLFILQ